MLVRLHQLLEGPVATPTQRYVRGSIQILILLNVGAVIVGTVEPWGTRLATPLFWFERISIALFSLEYLARIASCTVDPRYSQPFIGRLRWAVSPLALIDLLAVLPAYLPLVTSLDLRMLRAVRLVRVFRLLKLGRYSRAVQSLGMAFSRTAAELAVVALGLLILLVIASSALYYAETQAQPEAFSSIPAAMWWGVATLTTVGYGDVYPVTVLGKIATSIVAVLGVGLFAVPSGILASAFIKEAEGNATCPHCGREI